MVGKTRQQFNEFVDVLLPQHLTGESYRPPGRPFRLDMQNLAGPDHPYFNYQIQRNGTGSKIASSKYKKPQGIFSAVLIPKDAATAMSLDVDQVKADFRKSAAPVFISEACRVITHIPPSSLAVFTFIERLELDQIPWEAPKPGRTRSLRDHMWELSHSSAWHEILFVRKRAGFHLESGSDLNELKNPQSPPRTVVAQVQRTRGEEKEQVPWEVHVPSEEEKKALLLRYQDALKKSAEGGGNLVELEES